MHIQYIHYFFSICALRTFSEKNLLSQIIVYLSKVKLLTISGMYLVQCCWLTIHMAYKITQ